MRVANALLTRRPEQGLAQIESWVNRNRWEWYVETDLGFYYIERQGRDYYAFNDAIMLHNAKQPYDDLSKAMQRCEDHYQQLKWGDRM